MTRKQIIDLLIFVACIIMIFFALKPAHSADFDITFNRHSPLPPTEAYQYSLYHTGVFEVAKVFGRSPGCESADADLITETNDAAVKSGLDPRIAAAVIATESSCNQYAISNRGAIGLMQVNVSVWKNQFDFAGDVNLLNRHDNIQTGTKILARLVYTYGINDGIRRYSGLGVNCPSCDPMYVQKILSLGMK
jgi:hypothetical protein